MMSQQITPSLRETVTNIILTQTYGEDWRDYVYPGEDLHANCAKTADAAIRAVIEWLAAEAESRSEGIWLVDPVSYELDEWALPLPDWLRAHLPASDPEAGHE